MDGKKNATICGQEIWLRNLRNAREGRSQSEYFHGRIVALAYRLMPRRESLPSASGPPEDDSIYVVYVNIQ